MKKFKFNFEAFLALFVVVFVIVALLVPDDSLFKQIFAYITGAFIVLMFAWYTPLGNPLRRWLVKKGWL